MRPNFLMCVGGSPLRNSQTSQASVDLQMSLSISPISQMGKLRHRGGKVTCPRSPSRVRNRTQASWYLALPTKPHCSHLLNDKQQASCGSRFLCLLATVGAGPPPPPMRDKCSSCVMLGGWESAAASGLSPIETILQL